MLRRLSVLLALAAAAFACSAAADANRIIVNPAITHQTMSGWEIAPRVWEMDKANDRYDGSWLNHREEIAAALVNELGVNRIRLEIASGAENPADYWSRFTSGAIGYRAHKARLYEKINDNDDPAKADPGGFQFAALDYYAENLALPMRRLLEARGEKLIVNLCYVDFKWTTRKGTLSHAAHPAEYAELIAAAALHLREKYGLSPDYVEIILEPDNTDGWTGAAIAEAMVAIDARLSRTGMRPRYIAPSTAEASRAAKYFDAIARNKKALSLLDVFSYHRYDGKRADLALAGIVRRADKAGAQTAMLEFVGGRLDQLYSDLTDGNASAWQRYGVATIPDATGRTKPGYLLDFRDGRLAPKPGVAAMAQIFRNVRDGAVRLDARSLTADARALAFRNWDGASVVIVIADKPGEFVIEGLPPGRYTLSFAAKGDGVREDRNVVEALAGRALPVSAPATGVIAVKTLTPSEL